MQASGIGMMERNWAARPEVPRLARLLGKFVLDVLPGALASVIGTFLFAQYQFGHAPPRPVAEQAAPASAEMLALVRDEHAMIMSYLQTRMAAEKSRDIAEDAESARAVADAKAAAEEAEANLADARLASPTVSRHRPATAVAAEAGIAHPKPSAALAMTQQAPLVIAQAQPDGDDGSVPGERLASDPDSLLAKTLDIKDQVVAATRHVVAAIGDVFASVGERIGAALPGGRQFSSAS